MPLRSFLQTLAPVAARSPRAFLEAVRSSCEVVEVASMAGGRRTVVRLRDAGGTAGAAPGRPEADGSPPGAPGQQSGKPGAAEKRQ